MVQVQRNRLIWSGISEFRCRIAVRIPYRIQVGLFRSIGDLVYMPLATTGNLMRLVEAGYDFFVEKNGSSRRAFMVYACVIGAFAAGAIAGAFTTHVWGLHAIWVPAGLLAVTLILFIIDERERPPSK